MTWSGTNSGSLSSPRGLDSEKEPDLIAMDGKLPVAREEGAGVGKKREKKKVEINPLEEKSNGEDDQLVQDQAATRQRGRRNPRNGNNRTRTTGVATPPVDRAQIAEILHADTGRQITEGPYLAAKLRSAKKHMSDAGDNSRKKIPKVINVSAQPLHHVGGTSTMPAPAVPTPERDDASFGAITAGTSAPAPAIIDLNHPLVNYAVSDCCEATATVAPPLASDGAISQQEMQPQVMETAPSSGGRIRLFGVDIVAGRKE